MHANPKGKLYVCATPIGHLGDVSHRLLEILGSVALIACEDTRVTKKLLDRFDIKSTLISLQKYNENQRIASLEAVLNKGQDVALVSDAGTPNIADPGAYVIAELRKKDIDIIAVPGPSSLTAFLSISGVLANQFLFGGFFPKKESDAVDWITSAAELQVPFVFFESGLRVEKSLELIHKTLTVTEVVLGKELTKQFETIYAGPYDDVLARYKDGSPKGEWIVLIKAEPPSKPPLESVVAQLKENGLSASQIRLVAHRLLHYPKNAVYDMSHD